MISFGPPSGFSGAIFSGDLDGVETLVNTYEGVPRKMHDALLSSAKSATAMDAQSHSSAHWSTTTYCLWI